MKVVKVIIEEYRDYGTNGAPPWGYKNIGIV